MYKYNTTVQRASVDKARVSFFFRSLSEIPLEGYLAQIRPKTINHPFQILENAGKLALRCTGWLSLCD